MTRVYVKYKSSGRWARLDSYMAHASSFYMIHVDSLVLMSYAELIAQATLGLVNIPSVFWNPWTGERTELDDKGIEYWVIAVRVV